MERQGQFNSACDLEPSRLEATKFDPNPNRIQPESKGEMGDNKTSIVEIPDREKPPKVFDKYYGSKAWTVMHDWLSKCIQEHPDDVLEWSVTYFKDLATSLFPPEQIRDYEQWFTSEILGMDLEEVFPAEENESTGSAKVYTIEDIIEALPK